MLVWEGEVERDVIQTHLQTAMPRLAQFAHRSLKLLKNLYGGDDKTPELGLLPGLTYPCPHCRRVLGSEGDRARHIALRVACRRQEEILARIEPTSDEEGVAAPALAPAIANVEVDLQARTRAETWTTDVEAAAEETQSASRVRTTSIDAGELNKQVCQLQKIESG